MPVRIVKHKYILPFVVMVVSPHVVAHGPSFSVQLSYGVGRGTRTAPLERRLAPLSIQDALGLRTISYQDAIDVSPDGLLLAYVIHQEKTDTVLKEMTETKFSRSGVSQPYIGARHQEIWITNVKSRETRKLSDPDASSWSPVWSPDGRSLAFFSDRDGLARLWIWERPSENVRRVSDIVVRPVFAFQGPRWSPDGRQVLVRALHPDTPITGYVPGPLVKDRKGPGSAAVSGSTVTVFEADADRKPPPGQSRSGQRALERFDSTDRYFADLVLIDVATGRIQRIAEGVFPTNYWFNSRGDLVAYLSKTGQEQATPYQSRYDLVVVFLKDGHTRTVASNIESNGDFCSASWSPDGTQLTFADRTGEVYFASAEGGVLRKTKRQSTPVPLVTYEGAYRPPLWDATGRFVYFASREALWRADAGYGSVTEVTRIPNRNLLDILSVPNSGRFWTPDSRSLVVVARDEASQTMAFYSVDPSSGRSSLLHESTSSLALDGYGSVFKVDVSDDGRSVFFVSEDAQHPPDIWSAEVGFRNVRQVTHVNPELDQYVLGQTKMIEWDSLDGRRLHGALLLPAGYQNGKRYPLVVNVYGGALWSHMANNFGVLSGAAYNLQMLATRGYAVLLPDAPFNAGVSMIDLAKTVLPGVNKTIELGIADCDRLAIMGQSLGGYTTLALLVQTNRFKAAIVDAGFGNLVGQYGYLGGKRAYEAYASGMLEVGTLGLGGTPWEFRERYIENSPTFYLDRIQTPVLLLHGTEDNAIPVFLAEEIFVGLRRLGKTVTLAEYDGEGHGSTKRANIIDRWERIFKWLEKYLGTQPKDRTTEK